MKWHSLPALVSQYQSMREGKSSQQDCQTTLEDKLKYTVEEEIPFQSWRVK